MDAAARQGARWRGLVVWLVVTFVAATLGAIASADASARYLALTLPAWAPPPWVFGPVWTVLYAMMGIAAWRVWLAHGWRGARGPLALYLLQLLVNTLWTWLFFAWEQRGWATIEVLLLLAMVLVLQLRFARLSALAGRLLLPYLAWLDLRVDPELHRMATQPARMTPPLRRLFAAACLCAATLAIPGALRAQPGTTESTATSVRSASRALRNVVARRTASEITVDGVVNDAEWAGAEVRAGFQQYFPFDTSAAVTATEFRVAYDDRQPVRRRDHVRLAGRRATCPRRCAATTAAARTTASRWCSIRGATRRRACSSA